MVKAFFAGLVVLVLLLIVGAGTSWFGLVTERPMAKYAEETRRQVYVNSVAHLDGANASIGTACTNMRNVNVSSGERHAYASMVLQAATSYSGSADLSPESAACIGEAHRLAATRIDQ